mmetsp:Transcript_27661/g.57902  ORF Transcript_27661/g.57902 Transcript_27661/m.57902 type:complete len:80 (+) Transcript_27661:1-240(+)
MLIITLVYLTGQVTTFTLNVPRNNRLQTLDLVTLHDMAVHDERNHFENFWNFWNNFRTVAFCGVSIYLHIRLLQENSDF